MGTIAVYRNVRIVIYTRDHWPPHVHAIGPGTEAVFLLESLELIRCHGFDANMVGRIRDFLSVRREQLKEAWDEIH